MNDTMMQSLQHQKHAWALRHEMGFPADHKLTPSIEFGTGGAIDGGIVCELVLRAMERDQDIIYAGQALTGMSEPHEYLAVMRNQHLIHVFRCRPWSGDSNAPVILVSECGKVTIRLGSDGAFECLAGAPSDIAGGHCRALARIERVAAELREGRGYVAELQARRRRFLVEAGRRAMADRYRHFLLTPSEATVASLGA